MEFRILGTLQVAGKEGPIRLGKGRQRALLALLLLNPNHPVSRERLIDELWGERPPRTAPKILQNWISQLRKVLDDERRSLKTTDHGYSIDVEAGSLDLERFETCTAAGRQALADGHPALAARLLREALAIWRGPPLAEFASEQFAQVPIARLEGLHAAALVDRIQADLALSRHTELVPELDALVRQDPLDERLRELQMLALYRAGRQTEALNSYRRARETLSHELGLEPAKRLRDLEAAILCHEPWLQEPKNLATSRPGSRRSHRSFLSAQGMAAAALFAIAGTFTLMFVELRHQDGHLHPGTSRVVDTQRFLLRFFSEIGNGSMALTIAGGDLWIANPTNDTISRFAPRSTEPMATIRTVGAPTSLAAGDGSVWAAERLAGAVLRIDPKTNHVVDTIRVGGNPTGFLIQPDIVWVANPAAGLIEGLDSETDNIVARIDLDSGGHSGGPP
jgi:DNA-binding SARP family transcriptional activator